jgi:hypothetical protein
MELSLVHNSMQKKFICAQNKKTGAFFSSLKENRFFFNKKKLEKKVKKRNKLE